MVSPDLIGKQGRVIGACLCELIELLDQVTWQVVVDALTACKDEGIQEDQALDAIGQVFDHLADHRPAKAMPNQDHLSQVVAPDERDDGVDAVAVRNPNALIRRAMTNQCWCVGLVSSCLEMANDSLPGPTAMPCAMNQDKRFAHSFLLLTRVRVDYFQMLL